MQSVPGLGHVGIDVAPDTPEVLADPALLEQVLVNVLENAAKYGPPHGLVRVTAGWRGGPIRRCRRAHRRGR